MYVSDWVGMFFLVMLVIAQPANAQLTEQEPLMPAIGGYSPVSYFTQNRAEKGRAEFAVSHQGVTYFLTSLAQVELFKRDPDKYQPQHDLCPYSLALGKQLPLDPTNFKIVGDSLLLFHVSDTAADDLADRNSSKLDEQELLQRADSIFEIIRF